MTKDGWSSNWPEPVKEPIKENWVTEKWPLSKATEDAAKLRSPEDVINWPLEGTPPLTSWDLAVGDRTVLTTLEHDGIKHKVISQTELKSQGSNLVDSEAYLYFQCEGCNEILDPHTKSFKTLEEKRHAAGWKVRWNTNGLGYKVYCVKCGEKV